MKSKKKSNGFYCDVVSFNYESGGRMTTTMKGRRNRIYFDPKITDLILFDKQNHERIVISVSQELFDSGFIRMSEKRAGVLRDSLPEKMFVDKDINGQFFVSKKDLDSWIETAKNLLK